MVMFQDRNDKKMVADQNTATRGEGIALPGTSFEHKLKKLLWPNSEVYTAFGKFVNVLSQRSVHPRSLLTSTGGDLEQDQVFKKPLDNNWE